MKEILEEGTVSQGTLDLLIAEVTDEPAAKRLSVDRFLQPIRLMNEAIDVSEGDAGADEEEEEEEEEAPTPARTGDKSRAAERVSGSSPSREGPKTAKPSADPIATAPSASATSKGFGRSADEIARGKQQAKDRREGKSGPSDSTRSPTKMSTSTSSAQSAGHLKIDGATVELYDELRGKVSLLHQIRSSPALGCPWFPSL